MRCYEEKSTNSTPKTLTHSKLFGSVELERTDTDTCSMGGSDSVYLHHRPPQPSLINEAVRSRELSPAASVLSTLSTAAAACNNHTEC